MSEKKLMSVKLVKSMHGRKPGHKACVAGLGLRRVNQTVTVEDSPCTRGMVAKVFYMVQVVES